MPDPPMADAVLFSTIFCALGLKLLFGNHSVGVGTLMLLAAVSAAGTVALGSCMGKGGPDLSHLSNVTAIVSAAKRAWAAATQLVTAPHANV